MLIRVDRGFLSFKAGVAVRFLGLAAVEVCFFSFEAGLGVGLGTGLGLNGVVNILSSCCQHIFLAVYTSCFCKHF